jgi:aromatic-L-amino-acid/L-tryptophan decarboxylase
MGSLPLDAAAVRPLDAASFAADSNAVLKFIAEYYRDVDKYPVRVADLEPGRVRKLLPDAAPEHGEPMDDVLEDVRRDILPGLTHWQSPSFFAYFPLNASSAGFAREMLSAVITTSPEHGLSAAAVGGAVDCDVARVRNKPVARASTGLIKFGRGPVVCVAVVSVS